MRCFIAIDMPANVKRELLALQQSLTLGTAVRWTREDQLHLTLKFLSDIDDDALPAIKRLFSEVAAATPPFDFDIRGCGCFPPNGLARIVWAGIPDPPRALLDASGACESAFAAVGVRPENRPYRPPPPPQARPGLCPRVLNHLTRAHAWRRWRGVILVEWCGTSRVV